MLRFEQFEDLLERKLDDAIEILLGVIRPEEGIQSKIEIAVTPAILGKPDCLFQSMKESILGNYPWRGLKNARQCTSASESDTLTPRIDR